MKIFFVTLGLACLASSWASTSLKFPFDEEDGGLEKLLSKLEKKDFSDTVDSDIIITFPPIRTTLFPPRPTRTTESPTTSEAPTSTTTLSPSTTTTETSTTSRPTTSRPFPPRPTTSRPFPPRPTTSRPFPPRPTTSRPFPPRPSTSRPFPPRPTPNRNPQIFKNIFDSQGPFSGRLLNLVQNFRGSQATRQSNDIIYNIKFAKALKRLLEDQE